MSQVQEAVAEMGQRRRDLVARAGKDPAIILPVPEPAGITATTVPEVAAPKPQQPREIFNGNRHDAREYEDPFHISKMLLHRAGKERVERAMRGVYRGNRRLRDEFEPSLVSWRQELYAIALAISDRFEERKKGEHVLESYMSRCSDIFARIRYIDVGIKQLKHAVHTAKMARKAYMNSPARGRAERAALQAAEGRQPTALRRAQAIMAIEKTVKSLLYHKLPDWRAEISTFQQNLTGIPLQRGTVHICFGLQDKVYARVPGRVPGIVPAGEPAREPAREPAGEPGIVPAGEPAREPAGEPAREPAGEPGIVPAGEPAREPAGEPAREPAGEPAREPAGEPGIVPAGEPAGEPGIVHGIVPAGEPARVPAGEPARVPAGVPARVPAGEPAGEPPRVPPRVPAISPSIVPATSPARVPLSRKRLKRKVWGMQLDLNRLLKHDLPSWRAEIGLAPYDPAKGLPDARATHMHFRTQSQVPADAKLPDVDGCKDRIGMARESIRLHILVYIQTAIDLLESELAMWSREVHAIEERRPPGTLTSSVFALKSVYSRGAISHVSRESDHERLYTLEAYKRRFKRNLTSTFGFGTYSELDQLRFEDVSDVAKRIAAFSRIYNLVKRQRLRYGADIAEEPRKLSESEAQQWKDGVASLLANHQMLPLPEIPGVTSDLIADALRRGESRTSLMRTLLEMLSLRRRATEDGQISDVEHDFAARFRDASVTRWRRDFKVAMRNLYGFGRDYSIINSLDYEDLCFAKQRRLLFWKLSDMTRKGHTCFRIYNVKTTEAARSEMARWKLATKLQLRTSFGPGEYSDVDDVSMKTFCHDQRRSGFLLGLFRRLIHRQSMEASTSRLPQQQHDQNPETQPKVKLRPDERARKRRAQATSLVIKIETQRRGNDTLNSKQADVESEMERKQNAILQELREAKNKVTTEIEDYEVLRKQIAIEMMQAQYREKERKGGKMKARRVGRQMIEKLRALQVLRLARSNQAQSIALTKEKEAVESMPFFYEHRAKGEEAVAETNTTPQHDPDTLEATSSLTDPSVAQPETPFRLENEREEAMCRLRKLLLGKNHAQEARNVTETSEATMAHVKEQRDEKFIVTTTTFKPTESKWAPVRQTIDPDESATTGLTKEPNVEARQYRQSHGHLTHLTQSGSAHMVNITPKTSTHRLAVAIGTVSFSSAETLGLVRSAALKKGDVLGVTRIAGIQAAKLCPMIIPLCHPIAISGVEVDVTVVDAVSASQEGREQSQSQTKQEDKGWFHPPSSSHSLTATSIPLEYGGIHVVARVDCVGPTGVEMEALTAVMGACLTVIDMIKAVDRSASIGGVKVVRKMGGRSGDWVDEAYVDK
ncbi:molybdenum cofactor biosynthesis protein C [Venturia nashicola]|nr:molybdenum cofactor biosynthesis protein C [Venturia nashicola]